MRENMQRAANLLLEVDLEARLLSYITGFMVDTFETLNI